MKTYIPLKNALHEDDFTVGFKAAILSHLEKEFSLPFSLVLTSDVFFEFISYNTLGDSIRSLIETPLPPLEQSRAFVKLSRDFEKASFPSKTLQSLREAFELLSLDANNIQSLSSVRSAPKDVLALRRSMNYEDGDDVFSGLVLSKTDFDQFVKSIKSIYLSAFLPSSISYRQKKNIKDFSIAIIVSLLPEISSCIESVFDDDKNTITVSSYFGFLDPSKKVPRDVFEVAIDFLKVKSRSLSRQRIVSVFDMEANRPTTKQFLSLNSSQSIEEPKVLEIARLTKKIQQAMQYDRLALEFVSDKHSNLFLLDVAVLPRRDEKQQTLTSVSSEQNDDEVESVNPVKVYDVDESSLPPEDAKVLDELGSEFEKDVELVETSLVLGSREEREFLAKMIVQFISRYQDSPFKTEVDILRQALLHNPSQGMLIHGLTLCRDIVRSWDD